MGITHYTAQKAQNGERLRGRRRRFGKKDFMGDRGLEDQLAKSKQRAREKESEGDKALHFGFFFTMHRSFNVDCHLDDAEVSSRSKQPVRLV